MTERVRINLGSGHWKLDGWVNVDVDPACTPTVLADLSSALPFRDGVASHMHTEDFIDQLTLEQASGFLRECHRILAPGGVLRVLTPDLERLARHYLEDPAGLIRLWNEAVRVPLDLGTPGEVFNLGMRFAGHTFLYDAETMAALAEANGFEARQVAFNVSEEAALQGIDLRAPDGALSLYFDLYRVGS